MSRYAEILFKYWGYHTFRSVQEEIITSVCEGRDTLGLMPTGGGKSITFQVSSLAMEGICIVVTPLIALMKDQVSNLRNKRIKAAAVYTGMTFDEIVVALDNCILGNYKFLYISPERLASELLQVKLKQMNVCLLTVDESHCISQWGYDFRPSYLQIALVREMLPGVPVLALTATATEEVITDIQQKLSFPQENVIRTSYFRDNLAYKVFPTEAKRQLLHRLLQETDGSVILYVRNRRKTREIAELLCEEGESATYYHAGLTNNEKDLRQKAWHEGKTRIIVCTNAFGMGIDKPDVRLVVHLDLPDSIEAYFQEAGRAGRDRLPAVSAILCSKNDLVQLKKRVADTFPPRKFIREVYDALCNFLQIAEGDACGKMFEFNMAKFVALFHLPLLQTYHALKMLGQAGYLELTDEQDNGSRVFFTLEREELYHLRYLDRKLDELIHVLLRSYSGLFSDYTYINEEHLCQKINMTQQEMYDSLITLSQARILNYVPKKKTPYIIFRERRIDSKYLIISKEVFEVRKQRYELRIQSMLHYVTSNDTCRSRMLLDYFGEEKAKGCDICDVCLQKRRNETSASLGLLQDEILEKLSEAPLFISQLVAILSRSSEETLPVIRQMLDSGLLFMENGCLFPTKEGK
jgi:ATP-dependent DNA helicase RecQ